MKNGIFSRITGIIALFFNFTFLQAQVNPPNDSLQGLDDYIVSLMQEWQIPGLSLAIVKDDKVVLIKGYGLRQLGTSDAVDGNTLFQIGSLTKAFTATTLGILVDEGRVNWSDPIRQYLPDFALSDPCATVHANFVDLLCHRTGLPQSSNSLLWNAFQLTPSQVVQRLRYFPLEYPFRSNFTYNSATYVVIGQTIEAITGKPWTTFLKESLLTPLGMKVTTADISSFNPGENIAIPHLFVNGELRPIRLSSSPLLAVTEGLSSSATDLANWMRFNLAKGVFGGNTIISADSLSMIQSPKMLFDPLGFFGPELVEESKIYFPGSVLEAYGLGWMICHFHVHPLILHSGKAEGSSAFLGLLPAINVGVAVLANTEMSPAVPLILYRLLDLYFGTSSPDYDAEFRQIMNGIATASEHAAATIAANTVPSLPLSSYTGNYVNPAFGTFTIKINNGQLEVYWGNKNIGQLRHLEYDSFTYIPNGAMTLEQSRIDFLVDPQKGATGLAFHDLGFFDKS